MSDNGLELWLVRHGETTRSARREIAGWSNPPLTARGRHEAEALRPLLADHSFTGVWSSDLDRAVTTARLAWGEPSLDPRLRELDFGDLEGRFFGALNAALADAILRFHDLALPGGESLDQMATRILAFVDGLTPGRHLVFTHGGVVRLLTRDLGVDRFLPTGSLVVVDWTARRLGSIHEPRNGRPVFAGEEPER
jgi:probable phosphoglycerate mutase